MMWETFNQAVNYKL